MTEVTTAVDGKQEGRFERPPESERNIDLQHGVFRKYLDRPEDVTDVHVAEEVGAFLDSLERSLDGLDATIGRIEKGQNFKDLTAQAKARRIAEAIREPVEQIQRVSADRLAKAEQTLEGVEKRLLASVNRPQPEQPSTEQLIAEMRLDNRLREIRAGLAGMSELSRLAEVSKAAIERGKLEPLWALTGAPSPMADAKMLEDLQRRIVTAREPWRSELVELHRDIHRTVLQLSAGARSYVQAQLASLEDRFGLKARIGSQGFEAPSPNPKQRSAA